MSASYQWHILAEHGESTVCGLTSENELSMALGDLAREFMPAEKLCGECSGGNFNGQA